MHGVTQKLDLNYQMSVVHTHAERHKCDTSNEGSMHVLTQKPDLNYQIMSVGHTYAERHKCEKLTFSVLLQMLASCLALLLGVGVGGRRKPWHIIVLGGLGGNPGTL